MISEREEDPITSTVSSPSLTKIKKIKNKTCRRQIKGPPPAHLFSTSHSICFGLGWHSEGTLPYLAMTWARRSSHLQGLVTFPTHGVHPALGDPYKIEAGEAQEGLLVWQLQ